MKYIKYISEYLEYRDLKKPIRSFKLKKTLNEKVWISSDKMFPEIREKILAIVDDVWKDLEVDFTYDTVLFTGSMCSYNWSSYSDFDIHIITDYSKFDSANPELAQKYIELFRKSWNLFHNIKIIGYDIEITIKDMDTFLQYKAIYDLVEEKWLNSPLKYPHQIDLAAVENKAKYYMKEIDDLESQVNDIEYKEFKIRIKKVWESIKDGRLEGLQSKDGEMGLGNLVFKMLRRNRYIEKVVDLKFAAYDKNKSLFVGDNGKLHSE